MKFKPTLDTHYRPFLVELEAFERAARESGDATATVGVTGGDNAYAITIPIFAEGHEDENYLFLERLAKALLWVIGGHRIYLHAPAYVVERMRREYAPDGVHHKDAEMMAGVYEADLRSSPAKARTRSPPPPNGPCSSAVIWTAAALALMRAEATARSAP